MQIKRFEAEQMQDALKEVKRVLGPDAIILSTKTIKPVPGRHGYGRKKTVEVVAAVDRNPPLPSNDIAFRDPTRETPPFLQQLLSTGLTPGFVQGLLKDIPEKAAGESSVSEVLREYVQYKVMEAVDVTGPAMDGRRIWGFIGPSGVGKTTTMAKLAAHFSLKARKKITLVTLDTFRIGGVDQLKTYAAILNVPLEIASRPEELKMIIERHKDRDFLLIDTAGRSPSDSRHLEEMKRLLTVHPDVENHLLLSATTKESDMTKIVQRFSCVPIKSYIFTKLDETG